MIHEVSKLVCARARGTHNNVIKKGFVCEALKKDYRVATLFCEKYEVG